MKIIIYQILNRLFANSKNKNQPNGNIEENGCGKMKSISQRALQSIKDLGATHIWYTGILAHATQTDYTAYGIPLCHPAVVKGRAGSPYAINDYYSVDPDLATEVERSMKEFELLVARTHKADLKVLIDFVPNHVARQYHSTHSAGRGKNFGATDHTEWAFSPQNNFYYIPHTALSGEVCDRDIPQWGRYEEMPAKATGNDCFHAFPSVNDWYETVKLNYGADYSTGTCHFSPIPDTWYKMKDILCYWREKGVDGFRCDMVEMVPCEFWHWVIPQIKVTFPDTLFIGEVYNPALYRRYLHEGGFDYLYDKVGLYDTLRGVMVGSTPASAITVAWQAVDDIKDHMLYFLENHDEQRIASSFFAGNANSALPALVVAACLQKNPFMLYFGQEIGERGMDAEGFSGVDGRTTIFDYWNPSTLARWYNKGKFNDELLTVEERTWREYYKKVLGLCATEPALYAGEFFDLMYANEGSPLMNDHRQYAFLRKHEEELLFIVANFSPDATRIAVQIPAHAFEHWKMNRKEKVAAIDLLTGEQAELSFTDEQPTAMVLPAHGSRIWKMKIS